MSRSGQTRRARVVIAPDEFGGTLTAQAAAAAIAAGWRRARPDDRLDLLPQSDGGPGFVDVLTAAGVGRTVEVPAVGPLGEPVVAHLLLDDTSAYLESAQVCGLHLLGEDGPSPRSAWAADTAGLGMLLTAAVDAGARRIVVGLGGSATTDGGRGACENLGGWDAARALLSDVELVAATDVTNPLLGPTGAAAVFGPQKGADAATLARLEERLAAWVDVLEHGGRRVRDLPGSGAAGGLGAFLLALGAHRGAGASVVADVTDRAARIAAADLVITGEGRFDRQTAYGKVIAAVAADAASAAVPVVVIAGQVVDGATVDGVRDVYSMARHAGSVERSVAQPAAVAADVAEHVARTWEPTRGKGEGGMRE
ncbi:glycerate kinase [Gordonia phthalatica]|uniref:Glycerate kinase n=1 Tax=Gordonia phthalatica TaxID=1136941 RepID=A0A0N9NI54_9ACTN|nr:glycerate kinase [Gordonia phthalatica]ALG85188.1 hypothetical protein ACH46_12735 [Gordonia phthalatica]